MRHPNNILIVDDAENIVQDRKHTISLSDQAVSNLLNLSDGLLSDAIHQRIICTFNYDVQRIDPVLLRDGQLVLEHKFEKLTSENARPLCAKLNVPGNSQDIHESMLANRHQRTLKRRKRELDSSFGFYTSVSFVFF